MRPKNSEQKNVVSSNQLVTAADLQQLGAILFVGAHPDDETFTAGGILTAAAQNGQRVMCITATKGELGVQDESRWPAAHLGDIRAKEIGEALKILGCHEHRWLDFDDGHCADVSDDEGAEYLRALIAELRPDTILTFGPDGLTGHPDHQAISRWSRLAAGDIPVYGAVIEQSTYNTYLYLADQQLDLFFNTPEPPLRSAEECAIAFRLSPDLCRTKERALQAMPSQYAIMFERMPDDFIDKAFSIECFVRI